MFLFNIQLSLHVFIFSQIRVDFNFWYNFAFQNAQKDTLSQLAVMNARERASRKSRPNVAVSARVRKSVNVVMELFSNRA